MSTGQLIDAVREGRLEDVAAALDGDPEGRHTATGSGATLLHLAVRRNDPDMTRLLIDRGVALEVESAWGQTAFEWAALLGASDAAAVLLEAGAERLGLWSGAALGMLDVVRQAFVDGRPRPGAGRRPAAGVSLDGWPEDGPFRSGDVVSDAFQAACRNGHVAVAHFLLDHGADVDATGYFGAPAVHWAAINGHRATVEWLVSRGADLSVRDPEFDARPSGWAAEGEHLDLAAWLREREP